MILKVFLIFKEDFVGWLRWLLVLIYIPGCCVTSFSCETSRWLQLHIIYLIQFSWKPSSLNDTAEARKDHPTVRTLLLLTVSFVVR